MNSRIQQVPTPPPPPPRVWTSLDLIHWTKSYFEKKGIPSARLEAELLLAEVLGCPRIRLYVDFEKPVPAEALARFREFVRRRAEQREPLQYIVGHAQFIDLKLKVTPAVLIPRPETELLAAWALERLKEAAAPTAPSPYPLPQGEGDTTSSPLSPPSPQGGEEHKPPQGGEGHKPVRVLDLGTGSGCLALYLAVHEPRAAVIATDVSAEALALAAENARAVGAEARVTFRQGDLFAVLSEIEKGTFDLLVSNPPYVDPALRETLQPEVRDHEPSQALFADEAGLAVLRRILASASAWLKPGGWLGLEFGLGQAEALLTLAAGTFYDVAVKPDSNGLPRLLLCRCRSGGAAS